MLPDTKRVYLFTYRMLQDPMWVKTQVAELASVAEVVVKGVYMEKEEKKEEYTTLFRHRKVVRTRLIGYSYYAEILGPGLNVERFEILVKGFVRGHNSRCLQ